MGSSFLSPALWGRWLNLERHAPAGKVRRTNDGFTCTNGGAWRMNGAGRIAGSGFPGSAQCAARGAPSARLNAGY
jgi:hypothetical protein